MADHSGFLIRNVTDTAIVRDGDPTALPGFCEPLFVGCVMSEVVTVAFDRRSVK